MLIPYSINYATRLELGILGLHFGDSILAAVGRIEEQGYRQAGMVVGPAAAEEVLVDTCSAVGEPVDRQAAAAVEEGFVDIDPGADTVAAAAVVEAELLERHQPLASDEV